MTQPDQVSATQLPEAAGSAPAETPEVTDSLTHRVGGLACPSCGGSLSVEDGLRVVGCPFCRTPLLVRSEVGVRRLAVEPRIDAETARVAAEGWLARGVRKDRRLRREAELRETLLCFLPFYRVRADCVGFALGTEERRRWVGSGKNRRMETYEVDVERRVERSFDRTWPALNVAEWGIGRVDLRGDSLVPYDAELLARRGMVFPTTGSEAEVREAALELFRREADPGSGLKRLRFHFLETLRERLSVIHYPLWVVRYRFGGRSYQVLVDAEDGSLAYGKAPGNDLYRALMLVVTEAAAAFVATTALQVAGASLPALLFGGGIGLAIFVWGWRRFRWGGVVVEGSGVRPGPDLATSLGKAVRSPRGALADWLRRSVRGAGSR